MDFAADCLEEIALEGLDGMLIAFRLFTTFKFQTLIF